MRWDPLLPPSPGLRGRLMESVIDFSCLFLYLSILSFLEHGLCVRTSSIYFLARRTAWLEDYLPLFSPSNKKKEDVGGGDRNVDGRLRRHRLDYLSTSTPAKASVSFLYLVHLSSSSSFPKQNSSRVSCASLPPLVLISPPASKVDPDRKKPWQARVIRLCLLLLRRNMYF